LCRWTRRFATKSLQVIGTAWHEELGTRENHFDEVMPGLLLLGEIRGRVHRGVHVARELRLRFGEGGRKGGE
jgi:hypothetical protein